MIKVSIIVPSINPDKWLPMYYGMTNSCRNHKFEFIFVGPYYNNQLNGIGNIKFIRDFGSPSRCFQIGSLLAEGEYLGWAADDYLIEENAFDLTFEYIEKENIKDDGINLLHSEGPNFTGNQHLDMNYWNAHTHADLRFPGVRSDWTTHCAFMYKTETWHRFGGLDCGFEHVNMNTHDLGFAIQANGGRIIHSPCRVYRADWAPWDNNNKLPIQCAWEENDKPRFMDLYSDKDYAFHRKISIDNWKNCPTHWPRRFK